MRVYYKIFDNLTTCLNFDSLSINRIAVAHQHKANGGLNNIHIIQVRIMLNRHQFCTDLISRNGLFYHLDLGI